MIYHQIVDINKCSDPWIVMVHGFTQNCNYFSAQVPDFQKHFRILLIDLRGHGRSVHVTGPYGIEEYADDILQVLENIRVENAHYWGTHTGSAIGLVLALRQPERFASLVLEGASLPGFPMPRVGELIDRARAIAQSQGLQAARKDWFAHADWFDYIRAHSQACRAKEHEAMISAFAGDPWLSRLTPRQVTPAADCLASIHQPTLIYNGRYDLEDFKNAAAKLETDLPHAQQEVIPEAGGFPGWENPQAVNRLVRSFLDKQPRA
jgi:pimeloyl-ACP methyl ester carboxylesterase